MDKLSNGQRILCILAIVGPVLLMAALACTPGISFTEDLGRHLLLGQIISEEHIVPETNYLTYTHPDFPFINHHWLSEVIFYQLHRFVGYNGLILFKMLIMAGALALAMCTLRPRRKFALYWFTGLLAALLLGFRSHIRPELFSFVGVALYGWCFEEIRKGSRWAKWLVLLYAWIWSNAQIYFVFGIGMVGAFALERWIDYRDRKRSFRDLAWLAGMILVSCLNPNGISGLLYPLRIFSNYEVGITENASPLEYWTTVINPMLLALPAMTIIVLSIVWVWWRRVRCTDVGADSSRAANIVICMAALVASFHMARSVPLLALTAPAAVAAILVMPTNRKRTTHPLLQYSTVPLLLILNVWLLSSVVSGAFHRPFPSPIGPTPFGFDDESRYQELTKLRKMGLPGHVFSDYNLGSLVEYELYPEPGYVDNRPEAFPGPFWRTEYTPALALAETWEYIRQARDINTIIVSLPGVKEQYTGELMRRSEWILVHLDSLSGTWVFNSPDNVEFLEAQAWTVDDIDAYEADIATRLEGLESLPPWRRQTEADRIVYELYSLICIGEVPRTWPYLWQLHQMYPDYQIVHELMRVTAPPEHVNDVIAVMGHHAYWPVSVKQVLDWGRVLEAEGMLREARQAYQRGLLFFPLSGDLRATLDQLDDRAYADRLSGTPVE